VPLVRPAVVLISVRRTRLRATLLYLEADSPSGQGKASELRARGLDAFCLEADTASAENGGLAAKSSPTELDRARARPALSAELLDLPQPCHMEGRVSGSEAKNSRFREVSPSG
jgi:hypothetical protein